MEGPDSACGYNWKAITGVQAGDSERVRITGRAVKMKRNGHIQGCDVDSVWRMIKQQGLKMTQ